MKYYLLYIKSILLLKVKSSFCYFLAQFESKTVRPRSLGSIHILGYYENKSEIAIRNKHTVKNADVNFDISTKYKEKVPKFSEA